MTHEHISTMPRQMII